MNDPDRARDVDVPIAEHSYTTDPIPCSDGGMGCSRLYDQAETERLPAKSGERHDEVH